MSKCYILLSSFQALVTLT